jgi:hypothetical protein
LSTLLLVVQDRRAYRSTERVQKLENERYGGIGRHDADDLVISDQDHSGRAIGDVQHVLVAVNVSAQDIGGVARRGGAATFESSHGDVTSSRWRCERGAVPPHSSSDTAGSLLLGRRGRQCKI